KEPMNACHVIVSFLGSSSSSRVKMHGRPELLRHGVDATGVNSGPQN
ncbi:hypothetical protein A2U01_0091031, partial [Trifolium medium]|nr:hypothetical protein [Trifolium medium]